MTQPEKPLGELSHELVGKPLWGFEILQSRIEDIYSEHNRQVGYDDKDMSLKVVRHAGLLFQAGREDHPDAEVLDTALVKTFSWLTTYANETDISLQEVLEEKYGQGCPRCHNLPCRLSVGEQCVQSDIVFEREIETPETISGWKEHLAKIYPNNFINVSTTQALRNVTDRLLKEAVELVTSTDPEVQEPQNQFSQFHSDEDKTSPWRGEFADVLAWGLAVAQVIERVKPGYSFAKSIENQFENGCPFCQSPRCICDKKDTLNDRIRSEKNDKLILASGAEEGSPAS
jgi:hypothetical protein